MYIENELKTDRDAMSRHTWEGDPFYNFNKEDYIEYLINSGYLAWLLYWVFEIYLEKTDEYLPHSVSHPSSNLNGCGTRK